MVGNDLKAQIAETYPDVKEVEVPSCQIVTYGRYDFHRGSVSLADGKRLLIRVTETDLVRPMNKIREKLYKEKAVS